MKESNVTSYKNKRWLQQQYLVEMKSLREIAKECGTSTFPIIRQMKEFSIKRRTIKEGKRVKNALGDCKYCPQCKCIHLKTYFFKNKDRYDGLTAYCKSCMTDKHKSRGRNKINEEVHRTRNKHRKDYNRYMCMFRKTELGKENMKRGIAKRRKKLKWIPIINSNIFPEDISADWHHINNLFVIPIPKTVHNTFNFGNNVKRHRNECNNWINNNIMALKGFVEEIKNV